MLGLHSLDSRDENTATGEVVGLVLGGDGTLDGASGPEGVDDGTPGVLGVGSEVRGTVLSDGEARGLAGELQVNDAVGVDGGLDMVGVTFLVEGDGHVIGAEAEHLLVEHEVREGI